MDGEKPRKRGGKNTTRTLRALAERHKLGSGTPFHLHPCGQVLALSSPGNFSREFFTLCSSIKLRG